MPPAVCSSTALIAAALPPSSSHSHAPASPPSYRVCQSLPPVQEHSSMLHQRERAAELSSAQNVEPRRQNMKATVPLSQTGGEKQRLDTRTEYSTSRPHRPRGFLPKKIASAVHPVAPAAGFGCLVASSSVGGVVGLTRSRPIGHGVIATGANELEALDAGARHRP